MKRQIFIIETKDGLDPENLLGCLEEVFYDDDDLYVEEVFDDE